MVGLIKLPGHFTCSNVIATIVLVSCHPRHEETLLFISPSSVHFFFKRFIFVWITFWILIRQIAVVICAFLLGNESAVVVNVLIWGKF